MSTENLIVDDAKAIKRDAIIESELVEASSGKEGNGDNNSNIVPLYQITSDIEKSIQCLQKKVADNEKEFMEAMNKIEKHINEMEK